MPIDYRKYPPNWKTEIVPAVLKRANNCCERCELKNNSVAFSIKLWIRDDGRYKYTTFWFRDLNDARRESRGAEVNMIRVVLTVAHLDHDETNHDVTLDRLQAMCQICHLRYDAKEKYKRSLTKWKNSPSSAPMASE